MMEQIETALLAGQRRITLKGFEIDLNPPLKNDTRKGKEKEARRRAKEIMNIIN
jgi:hypothetical protein